MSLKKMIPNPVLLADYSPDFQQGKSKDQLLIPRDLEVNGNLLFILSVKFLKKNVFWTFQGWGSGLLPTAQGVWVI